MHVVRTGLVDNDSEHLKLMWEFLGRYERKEEVDFSIEEYRDGLSFVEGYSGILDVILLDIEMPHINGMTAVEKIRERDQTLGVASITSMAQFAIHGYEADTTDFIVKPVSYYVFADKLKKAIRFSCAKTEKELVAQTEELIVKLASSQLLYIGKGKNYLVYRTLRGEFRVHGTLITPEESLKGEDFPKRISGYLVNLRYVMKISKDMVWAEQTPLSTSRHRSREFEEDFMRYLGGDY